MHRELLPHSWVGDSALLICHRRIVRNVDLARPSDREWNLLWNGVWIFSGSPAALHRLSLLVALPPCTVESFSQHRRVSPSRVFSSTSGSRVSGCTAALHRREFLTATPPFTIESFWQHRRPSTSRASRSPGPFTVHPAGSSKMSLMCHRENMC